MSLRRLFRRALYHKRPRLLRPEGGTGWQDSGRGQRRRRLTLALICATRDSPRNDGFIKLHIGSMFFLYVLCFAHLFLPFHYLPSSPSYLFSKFQSSRPHIYTQNYDNVTMQQRTPVYATYFTYLRSIVQYCL